MTCPRLVRCAVGAGLLALASCSGAPAKSKESKEVEEMARTDDVTVEGREATIPHQHLIDPARARDAVYVDVDGGGQIVAYIAGGRLPCAGRVRLVGRWIDGEGQSKRPGDTTRVSERQLEVTRAECLESP
jgi:hypothetical protein